MTEKTISELLRITPEPERAELLDRLCGGNTELRARLETLPIDDSPSDSTGPYIPPRDTKPTASETRGRPGTVIAGRYRLVEIIGEGGMGSVFRAEQSEPVKRQVAIKLIKGGLDSRAVLHRFEAERQALALMDHPNIAKVFDGGLAPDGRPYFAMELVPGQHLTKFCDDAKLTARQRLELFVPICQAVQHAHNKGIIHRDLKPTNILVASFDGQPIPKVIDFGVAKAMGEKPPDDSLATEFGAAVGTLEYMSPEQTGFSGADVDTRSDIYSLGVILYELLTGLRPFDRKRLEAAALDDMIRIIRKEMPSKPSTRLSTDESLPSLAACRQMAPKQLTAFLRELDWVVMKCLEKDRNRRYETANGLARDIQRFLADEPVEARPPSVTYRLQKFIRRNRIVVAAGAAVAAALLIGIVGFAWQAKIAGEQRDRAVYAEGETKKRADELKQVADYQAKMLQQVAPTEAGVKLMTDLRARHGAALEKHKVSDAEKLSRTEAFERELRAVNATDVAVALLDGTVLAPAVRTIETQFAAQPLVDASLRNTLGGVYDTLGRRDQALELYQRAYNVRAQMLGDEHRDTLMSRGNVGKVLGALQRLPEADRTLSAALSVCQRVLGDDALETLDMKALLALQKYYEGKYEESETITRDILERRGRVQGPDHLDTLTTKNDLGKNLMVRGKYAAAVEVLREVLESQRRMANPSVSLTLTNLGLALHRQREYAAAEPYLREALEQTRLELGEDHPTTLGSMCNLATLLMDRGKFVEAEPLAKESLDKCRRIQGNEHADTLKAINVMGQVLFRQNKFAETDPYYREALATGRRVLGENHPDTIIWTSNLGFLFRQMGRIADAEPFYHEALEKNRQQLGATHPHTLTMTRHLVDLLQLQDKLNEAEACLREAMENVRRVEGEDHPEMLGLIRTKVELLRRQNKPTEAEVYLRGALETALRRGGEKHPEALGFMGLLGGVLRDQGKLDEAGVYFQQVIEASRRLHGEEHPNTLLAILRLASLLVAQGKNAEVVALLTPIEEKVRKAFLGTVGTLRHASLRGLLGKARAGLAKESLEFAEAEANMMDAQITFTKIRGENDKEAREWTQALVDFYTLWDKAEPGKGYDAKAAEWKNKLGATK